MPKKRHENTRKSRKGLKSSSSFGWGSLATWLQLSLVAVVPSVYLKGLYHWVELPKSALIQVGAVVILLVWFMGAISGDKLRIVRTPLDLPLLGFVSWAGLSLLWAHNFYEGLEIGIQWSACLILFFLTVNLVQGERDIRRLLGVLLIAGSLAAVLGIFQYLLEVQWVPQIVPPSATFANRNMAAQFMVVTIPLAAGFLLLSKRGVHILLAVATLGVLGLFLFYASTRSAWLAAFVEILLLAVLLGRDHFKWRLASPIGIRKVKALAVCAMMVFVLMNLTPSGFQWQIGSAWDRIREVTPGAQPRPLQVNDEVAQVDAQDHPLAEPVQYTNHVGDSLTVRFRLWRNTIRMGTEHFLKGVGIGNFSVFYPRYARSAVVDPVFTPRAQWSRSHNDYAQTFAELGLVGLFFLGWLSVAVIKISVALLGQTGDEQRYLIMGVILALCGLAVIAFFSFPFRMATPTFIFVLYLGVLGGYFSRLRMHLENGVIQHRASLLLPSWIAPVGISVTILFLLIFIPFQYNRLVADGYYNRVKAAARRESWSAVVSQANKGYPYYPHRKEFLFEEGRAYLWLGDLDGSIEAMEEFLEVYPYFLSGHHNIAQAYVRKGNTDRALQHYNRVFEIIPEYGPAHFDVAQLHLGQNEVDEALEHYRLAVEDEPDNALFLEKLGNAALLKELLPEAEAAFERALKNDPENSGMYLRLGVATTQRKEFERARVAFSRAVELDPNSAEARYRLGTLLFLIFQEKEEGSHHLKQVIDLQPSGLYAEEARRLIENH